MTKFEEIHFHFNVPMHIFNTDTYSRIEAEEKIYNQVSYQLMQVLLANQDKLLAPIIEAEWQLKNKYMAKFVVHVDIMEVGNIEKI